MEDREILGLYWKRSENAITETRNKYGKYLLSIAAGILRNNEDAQECENDTYMKAWNRLPPDKPDILSAFLGKITRNLSLDLYEKKNAQKRGGGEIPLILEELEECLSGKDNGMQEIENHMVVTDVLNHFLEELPLEKRNIFIRRYWYADTVKEISKRYDISESKVKMTLARARQKLQESLEQEGIRL